MTRKVIKKIFWRNWSVITEDILEKLVDGLAYKAQIAWSRENGLKCTDLQKSHYGLFAWDVLGPISRGIQVPESYGGARG